MAVTTFKKQFDNAYQEIFDKILVAKSIANMRFESNLKSGASVERVILDMSGVRVRTVVRNSDSTIDTLTDSSEFLTINLEKEIVFTISDGEQTQAGELNTMERAGMEAAKKLATDLDARVLAETRNALYDFDNGDLTTLTSDGTGITLSATTVPQMISQMPAKLRYTNNIDSTNLAFVIDSYAASQINQYLLSKQFDVVNSVFKNGYTGVISNAEVYVSENLTGEAVLTDSGTFGDGETFIINGVTFTMKTAMTPAAGEIVIGADLAASMTNIAAAINAPSTTTATFTALSAANAIVIADTLKLAATATATTVTVVGTGSGRLRVSETGASTSWSKNVLHAYYGKKGAIDLVVQSYKEVDVREDSRRRSSNVFSSYLAGVKTFADGAKKFLDVLIVA